MAEVGAARDDAYRYDKRLGLVVPLAWVLRPIVWFVTASIATTVVHELTHAVSAYALGVRSTLFNYWVALDPTATGVPVSIRLAGPAACLVLGSACWFFVGRSGRSAKLPLFYLAVFGIATFFGNLMSLSFVGDFSSAAEALRLSMPARYAGSVIGALMVAVVLFRAGRTLRRWVPAAVRTGPAVLGIIVVPVVAGTTAVILANLPTPGPIGARVGEASFWVLAALGALTWRRSAGDEGQPADLRLRWTDGIAFGFAILIVRLLVRGVPFSP